MTNDALKNASPLEKFNALWYAIEKHMGIDPECKSWGDDIRAALAKTVDVDSVSWIEETVARYKPKKFESFKFKPKNLDEAKEYIAEIHGILKYEKGRADVWRGIASAMGYEPLAHKNVQPKDKWSLARIEMFKLQTAKYLAAQGLVGGAEWNYDMDAAPKKEGQ